MKRQNVWGLGTGVLMVGLGILFLIGELLPGNAMRYLWPFFLIAIGALFFMGMVAGGKATGALAIPGSIMTMLGLIFLVQAIFNIWATWAYAWALLIVAVGIGLNIFSLRSEIPQLRFVGRLLILIGGALFFLFGVFFEAIFALGGARSAGGVLWAVLLILAGIFLLFGREKFGQWFKPVQQTAYQWTGADRSSSPTAPDISTPDGIVQENPAAGLPLEDVSSTAAWTDLAPGEIRQLNFRSIGDVTIVQGESEGLVVDAPDSVKARLRSRVQNGVLEIWHENSWWDWLDIGLWGGVSIHYHLNVRSLESIHVAGASNIRADELRVPRLEIDHNGLGNLTIGVLETNDLSVHMGGLGNLEIKGGHAGQQAVDQSGAGSYRAGRLASRTASVNLSGLGSASVWVSDSLDAHVSGLGSIDYFGSPQVNKSVSGLGSINAR
jgi:hypothetical protein